MWKKRLEFIRMKRFKVRREKDRSSLVREREYIHKRINNNNTKWRILIPGKWYSKSVEGKGNISLMVLGKLVLLVDFIIIEYSPSPLPYWPLFCQAHLRGRITLLTHGCQCWSYDLHHPIKCEWRRLCHVWGEALIIKVQIDRSVCLWGFEVFRCEFILFTQLRTHWIS